MKNLRIIFMGTPLFAVATLKTLVEEDYNVVAVITAPDKPAGRGRKLQQSDVKKYAQSQNLPILQPTNLKDTSFLEELKTYNANLQIVVAFRMLPRSIWELPKYGTFNLHASLLPNYRGAAPINWAIINGENKTGVTTFFIDENIDTGAIILKEEVIIEPTETAGELHNKLMDVGSKLVLKTVQQIENDMVTTTIQKTEKIFKKAPKLNKNTCKINWNESAENIYHFIRGLSPFPTAWGILENNKQTIPIKIYNAEKEIQAHQLEIGKIIVENRNLKVAVKNGFIHLKEIQFPGKRKMHIKDVLNGYIFEATAKMC